MQIQYGILAGVVTLITVASTVTTGQAPVSAVPVAQAAPAAQAKVELPDQSITVTGCVIREADYRRTLGAGKGGAAGTGVGVGNEFVLTRASASPAGAASSTGAAGAPVGTSGTDATSYELTGSNEARAEQFVGKRVEITGTLKKADAGATGPTGGPTAGQPPSGVDVTSKDLKLRELEVASVRESTGTCPSQ
jgi:hypothetical protein